MDAVTFARLSPREQDQVLRRLRPQGLVRLGVSLAQAMRSQGLAGEPELGSWLSSAFNKVKKVVASNPIAQAIAGNIPIVGPLLTGGQQVQVVPPGFVGPLVAPQTAPQTAPKPPRKKPFLKPKHVAMIGVGVGAAALLAVLLTQRRR